METQSFVEVGKIMSVLTSAILWKTIRSSAAAAQLQDGKLLVTGGVDGHC